MINIYLLQIIIIKNNQSALEFLSQAENEILLTARDEVTSNWFTLTQTGFVVGVKYQLEKRFPLNLVKIHGTQRINPDDFFHPFQSFFFILQPGFF